MSAPFLRDRPLNSAHVLYMPTRKRDLGNVFIFFFAYEVWSKVVQNFQNILTDEHQAQTKKTGEVKQKKQKGTQKTCAKFHGLNPKNGVDIRPGTNFGFLT